MAFGKYLLVFFGSALKFIVGPTTGMAWGLTMFETIFFTVLGMMTSVVIFSSLGEQLRKQFIRRFGGRRRRFTPRNRRLVRVWRRYGLPGVAFLTPILLSPIVGTILAASFGEPRGRIMWHMLVSALFWGLTLSLVFLLLGRAGLPRPL